MTQPAVFFLSGSTVSKSDGAVCPIQDSMTKTITLHLRADRLAMRDRSRVRDGGRRQQKNRRGAIGGGMGARRGGIKQVVFCRTSQERLWGQIVPTRLTISNRSTSPNDFSATHRNPSSGSQAPERVRRIARAADPHRRTSAAGGSASRRRSSSRRPCPPASRSVRPSAARIRRYADIHRVCPWTAPVLDISSNTVGYRTFRYKRS